MSAGCPRLLDLFAGAQGAGVGYARAGYEVHAVDIEDHAKHPEIESFTCANAFNVLADVAYCRTFDAIHASPVCKDHSKLRTATGRDTGTAWQLPAARDALTSIGRPWVIENVPGAPMRPDYKLCGCMFGLPGLRRERWFETSWRGFDLRPPCHHIGPAVGVTGHGMQGREYKAGILHTQADRRAAMGIDWMNRDQLAQAIPPPYTRYIGEQMLQRITPAQEAS